MRHFAGPAQSASHKVFPANFSLALITDHRFSPDPWQQPFPAVRANPGADRTNERPGAAGLSAQDRQSHRAQIVMRLRPFHQRENGDCPARRKEINVLFNSV